jgi:transposase InsO family protein
MDFLSLSAKDKSGHDAVLVVVDRLSKRSHTLPSYTTATARDLAMLFYRFLWRIYGTPISIVSDRGPQFVANFWDELCRILRVKIKLSTSRHPQSNGQSEIMNQYIVQRLRPFVSFFQDNWSELLPAMDFAQASLPSETTGLSPFEIEFGRKSRMSFDWKEQTTKFLDSKDQLNRQEAQQIADRIHEAWAVARNNMSMAQAKQRRASNRKRREVNFGVGDDVYVLREGWQSQRPSQKLDWIWSGPYKILEKRGESFRLDLPPQMRIHPVFAPDRLRKAAAVGMVGQVLEPPQPEIINGEEEWNVEEVLASRVIKKTLQYKVRWSGYDEADPQWYPARNFAHAPSQLRKFHLKHGNAEGPPANLESWLKAEEEERRVEEHPDDDRPAPGGGGREGGVV